MTTKKPSNDEWDDDFSAEEVDFDNLDPSELGLGGDEGDREVPVQRELLTLRLLQSSIEANHSGDRVMADFAQFVLPNLLNYAIGVTAKGGWFFEALDRRNQQEGKTTLRRDNAADQSLNTHILNGLFPANLIERRLQQLNTNARRLIREPERRLGIAGFVLHDFEKFDYQRFSNLPECYQQISRNLERSIRKLVVEGSDRAILDEHRELFRYLVPALGIDRFLRPDNPAQWQEYSDDLLYIAYNAQVRYDTNLNLGDGALNPQLSDRALNCLIDLACLADSLASIVKHPQDAEQKKFYEILHRLSDGQLKLSYHSIAENRGVLTNIVNNAVMEAHTDLNTADICHYQPLLYLPTGAIYLATRGAPAVDPETLPDRVVATIKALCAGELRRKQTGFSRDGKGMKYADYYNQFFDDRSLMQVALDATLKILNPKKSSVAQSRSDNLQQFQAKGVLSADFEFNFGDDIRIDQIAEFGDVATRKIWGDRRARIEAHLKATYQGKQAKAAIAQLPEPNLIAEIARRWQLEDCLPQIREIQRINETLKELKLKGNTGGVPYEWYFLAAQYLKRYPGQSEDDIRKLGEQVIGFVLDCTAPIAAEYRLSDGWDDLRAWTRRVISLPAQPARLDGREQVEVFLQELNFYQAAKKPGRGRQPICSISNSPYSVSEQMESAVLFTPQVYTNKQMLGGSNAKRNISSIASTEMMLRQILMNQTQATGKRFEDGKYRYLYFYPTYYFTPETNNFLARAYSNIAQTRFDTSLRNHFVSSQLQADFSRDRYQAADAFLIDVDLKRKQALPEGDKERKIDRTFKLAYPEDKPLTFYFMALPPGRKPKDRELTDTESWVMPAWLALAFPNILDVKTVVSESPIPPYRDGSEFEETVFLDSAPHAFRALLQRDRFRLHHLLEGWQDDRGVPQPAPLNALTAAYAIHLDVNIKRGKSGYDANWGKFSELASNLETSPLYVFHYLSKWSRGREADAPDIRKIRLYLGDFYPCFDAHVQINLHARYLSEMIAMNQHSNSASSSPINHPKNLTLLYRKFYRASKAYNAKANAVLKPIDIAAETILKAESTVFQGETLVAAVAAEICKLMDRVHNSTAEGRWVISDREVERQEVLAFAEYFVREVFEGAFRGDRARLAGRQINLIRDTCEFLYRLEQDRENQERKAESQAKTESAKADNVQE